ARRAAGPGDIVAVPRPGQHPAIAGPDRADPQPGLQFPVRPPGRGRHRHRNHPEDRGCSDIVAVDVELEPVRPVRHRSARPWRVLRAAHAGRPVRLRSPHSPAVVPPTVIHATVIHATVIHPTVIPPTVIHPPVIHPTVGVAAGGPPPGSAGRHGRATGND